MDLLGETDSRPVPPIDVSASINATTTHGELNRPRRVFSLYLLPEFCLRAFSSAIEALKLGNKAVGVQFYGWRIVSHDGEPVQSSCGVRVAADVSIRQERIQLGKSESPSFAVVCGGDAIPQLLQPLGTWLRECRRHRVTLGALCGGVFVLARAGLADGRRCAVHWEQYPVFSEEFPEVEWGQTAFEIDGDIHTCPGGDAPFDMFLRIVESDHNSSVMNKAGDLGLANRVREAGERQRQPIPVRHEALAEIVRQMEDSVAEPVTLSTLAARSNLSRRQIERLFLKQLGCSPARYYLDMRLERAHLLLSSSRLSVTEIAIACGFGSVSYFSKTYRYSYGCTPQRARLAALERRASKPGNAAAGARHSALSSLHPRHVHIA